MLFRFYTYPISWMSYAMIHHLGKALGLLAYYLIPKYRKRALSNLALATDLHLTNSQIVQLAKKSLQSAMITFLEYPKLEKESNIGRIATCENPEEADAIMSEGKGLIFFCGHQANWELLFLEGTSRMPGVAIGRPIKNKHLYDWVLSIRQRFGGKIITPKSAIKEGLRALKQGSFLGIVGDQGMPDSGFSSLFLGRRAWTSPIAALLSFRTGRPIIVATTRREKSKYIIHYSSPIWPNTDKPMEEETNRMMHKALELLEMSITEHVDQWLWIHNRWKQQLPGKLKPLFRQECICIILPEGFKEDLSVFRELYPLEFITVKIPRGSLAHLSDAEIVFYDELDDLLTTDYRFKLIFNFTAFKKLRAHYLSLSAFAVIDAQDLKKLAPNATNFPERIKQAIYAI